MPSQTEIVRSYFTLLETFASDAASFAGIIHPEMMQTEYPNALNRNGQQSNFADLLKRAAIGKTMLAKQQFEISQLIESGERVVVEALWRGTPAKDLGPLQAGRELKAYFCIVLEFRDGKIFRQRNYDCFEPFS